jgi:spindle assembly abnormal protein 6
MSNADLDRRHPLFDAAVPVTVLAPGSDPDAAPRALVVRVLAGSRMTLGQREKLLHIEITDDSDLLFLYTLDVSEDEFSHLKHDQSLLVDFSSFPPSFIELLQQCSTAEPVFSAVLDTTPSSTTTASNVSSSAELRIVEKNQFKNLTHLALRFRAGTDASTKAYLASRVAQFTEILDETSTNLAATRNTLAGCQKEGAETRTNLDALRARAASDLDHMRSKFESEKTRQEAEYSRRVAEIQQQHAEDVRDNNARVEESTRELRVRAEKLEAERADHLEHRARLEASMMQLEGTHKGAADEIAGLREEVNTVREENRKLDAANFRNEKSLTQSEEKLKAYAQEVRDKTELLEQMSLRLEEAAEQRTHLEDTLALLRENQERLHAKFQDSVGEINKGNAIIQRMQAENKQLRSKLKLKSKVLRRQEELVAEKNHALDTAHRERLAQGSELTRVVDRAELAESKLERVNTKLEESKQLLESNGQVIKWLNQEINQMQLTGRRSLGPSAAALGLAEVELSNYNRFRPKQFEPRHDSISGGLKTPGALVDPSGNARDPSIYVKKFKVETRAPMTAKVKTLAAPSTTSNFASANMFGDDVPLPLQSVP